MNRGYEEQQLDWEIQQVLDIPREMDSQPCNDQDKSARIQLVVTYHPTLPSLGITTRQHQNILHTLEWLQKAFPSPPLIAFRRPNNLRDLLVRAKLTSNVHRAPGNGTVMWRGVKRVLYWWPKTNSLATWPASNTKWKDIPLVRPPT